MSEADNHSIAPVAMSQHELQKTPEHWENVYAVIEGLGLQPDPIERANQVAEMTGAGMFDVAKRLHTALAPNESHEPTLKAMNISAPNGENKRALLAPEEREGLYDYAASLIRGLAVNRGAGEDQAFLDRAANVTALTVVLAHPFEDGNGRTARTMAHLLREGYDGDTEVREDLRQVGSNRPPSGFRINSYLPTGEGRDLTPTELLTQAAAIDIPLAQEPAYMELSARTFTMPYGPREG